MLENNVVLSEELNQKLEKQYIACLGALAVGFSGGVDSSLRQGGTVRSNLVSKDDDLSDFLK